jgi:two-component system sensor histidine kinase/response regulator
VPGLEAAAGLARVGGNRALYVKLLRQFVAEQGPALDQVAAALSTGDRALAERLAHSLKGVAGNLGATRVQSEAGVLERLIRERASADEVDNARLRVDRELAPLTTALGAILGARPASPAVTAAPSSMSVDPAQSREAATKLVALLSESDPGASEFIQEHRDALVVLFDPASFAEFEALVDGYAFADAHDRLTRARATFAGSH